jgi:ABC-type sugar transport system permease subunit
MMFKNTDYDSYNTTQQNIIKATRIIAWFVALLFLHFGGLIFKIIEKMFNPDKLLFAWTNTAYVALSLINFAGVYYLGKNIKTLSTTHTVLAAISIILLWITISIITIISVIYLKQIHISIKQLKENTF